MEKYVCRKIKSGIVKIRNINYYYKVSYITRYKL